jgi:hypothetical protein
MPSKFLAKIATHLSDLLNFRTCYNVPMPRKKGTLEERQTEMRTRVTRAVAAKTAARIAAKAAVETARMAARLVAREARKIPRNRDVKAAGGVLVDWPQGPLE